MNILYFECNMGAAGDMIMSSLLELHENPDDFMKRFNNLNIPLIKAEKETSVKCGITGTHINIFVDGVCEDEIIHDHAHHHEHHHHTGLHEIEHILSHINIPECIRKDALNIYTLIADAESHAHGKPIDQIHFHEVGTMDAIADVISSCMLIHEISPDKIVASPICTGYGSVKCAHGTLPVPAPATSHILRGVPVYAGDIQGELCTPTGAAILKYFVSEFNHMPLMSIKKVGYGMGKKDFESANCIRAMLGNTVNKSDTVTELRCNIDDMTGEELGFAVNTLLEHGALDVFTTPVYMKKNRPGSLLTCICNDDDTDIFVSLIFKHTSTIGIRQNIANRYVMYRREIELNSNYGTVRGKKSTGYGVTKIKPEYDDLSRIAKENNISISDIIVK